jgi:formyl-CoA transferase
MALTPADARAGHAERRLRRPIGGMFGGGGAAAGFERERTGRGTTVDVSLLGTACWVLAPDLLAAHLHHAEMPRFPRTENPNPLVNSYRTRDRRWLYCNILQPDRCWDGLVAEPRHGAL